MKKRLFATFAALVTGMTIMTAADASDIPYYNDTVPYFYMKAAESGSEDYEVLRSGAVYYDRSKAGEEKDLIMDVDIFIKDEAATTDQFYFKAKSRTDDLQIISIEGPISKYGCSPYTEFTEDESFWLWCHDNMCGFRYGHSDMFNEDPFELTGENSDDYALACFQAMLVKNVANGSYHIDYPKMNEENYLVSIHVPSPVYKSCYVAEYSRWFYVHVSDRALGDIDGDGTITTMDAEKAMQIYSDCQNHIPVHENEKQAADVNGDEKLDDEDIALILEYCAEYNGKTPDVTLNEFVKSK